jgi:hypothetical protein
VHPSNSQVIARALGFSEDDLATNRAGQTSGAQRQRMRKSRSQGRVMSSVVGLIMVAFIAVIAIVYLPRLSKEQEPGGARRVRRRPALLRLRWQGSHGRPAVSRAVADRDRRPVTGRPPPQADPKPLTRS